MRRSVESLHGGYHKRPRTPRLPVEHDVHRMAPGMRDSRGVDGERERRLKIDRGPRRERHSADLEHLARRVASRLHEVNRHVDQETLRRASGAAQREVHAHPAPDRHASWDEADPLRDVLGAGS